MSQECLQSLVRYVSKNRSDCVNHGFDDDIIIIPRGAQAQTLLLVESSVAILDESRPTYGGRPDDPKSAPSVPQGDLVGKMSLVGLCQMPRRHRHRSQN